MAVISKLVRHAVPAVRMVTRSGEPLAVVPRMRPRRRPPQRPSAVAERGAPRCEESHSQYSRSRRWQSSPLVVRGPAPSAGTASSHREAPSISEDPTADNTDLYAFRSPDRPDTVTIISNVIPAEDPAAGPMYYEFSPSARYNIYLDRNGDGRAEITYRFSFRPSTNVAFLRNTVQPYTVTRIEDGRSQVVASAEHAAEQRRLADDSRLPAGRTERRRHSSRAVGWSSQVSVTTASSATSERSSTRSASGAGPATQAVGRTSSPATAFTPSRCRSRSPAWPTRTGSSGSGLRSIVSRFGCRP